MKAEDFDRKFDEGEDVTELLDPAAARRPGQEARRVNVDFPVWMIESLDRGVESGEHPLAPEGDKGIEQRRGRGAAGDRDTDGHEQIARLPAVGLCDGAKWRLELVCLDGRLGTAAQREGFLVRDRSSL